MKAELLYKTAEGMEVIDLGGDVDLTGYATEEYADAKAEQAVTDAKDYTDALIAAKMSLDDVDAIFE